MIYSYVNVTRDGPITAIQEQSYEIADLPEFLALLPEGANRSTHYVLSGELVPYTETQRQKREAGPPDSWHQWSMSEMDWVDSRSLDELKTQKIADLNAAFERAASALTLNYPRSETLTWGIQQSEALAWQADNGFPTPYLDGLAAARDIDPLVMRQKTLAKVLAFMSASQALVGTRQRLEDAVNVAQDRSEVDAIVWPT